MLAYFKKRSFFVGILSFLLPGLGQVYLRMPMRAALFFAGFTIAGTIPGALLFLPLVAFAAAWDAFRQAEKILPEGTTLTPPENWRASRFAAVGFIGFMGWMMIVSPQLLPVGSAMEANQRAEWLATQVRGFNQRYGHYPNELGELPDLPRDRTLDPWGTPYVYRRTERGFELRSAGRDHRGGTNDDMIYHFR